MSYSMKTKEGKVIQVSRTKYYEWLNETEEDPFVSSAPTYFFKRFNYYGEFTIQPLFPVQVVCTLFSYLHLLLNKV